jgi:hypothetical protein
MPPHYSHSNNYYQEQCLSSVGTVCQICCDPLVLTTTIGLGGFFLFIVYIAGQGNRFESNTKSTKEKPAFDKKEFLMLFHSVTENLQENLINNASEERQRLQSIFGQLDSILLPKNPGKENPERREQNASETTQDLNNYFEDNNRVDDLNE